MDKVTIYLRYASQSPKSQASVVYFPGHFMTIRHVNKHEIVFHNLDLLKGVQKCYTCTCFKYNGKLRKQIRLYTHMHTHSITHAVHTPPFQ